MPMVNTSDTVITTNDKKISLKRAWSRKEFGICVAFFAKETSNALTRPLRVFSKGERDTDTSVNLP